MEKTEKALKKVAVNLIKETKLLNSYLVVSDAKKQYQEFTSQRPVG